MLTTDRRESKTRHQSTPPAAAAARLPKAGIQDSGIHCRARSAGSGWAVPKSAIDSTRSCRDSKSRSSPSSECCDSPLLIDARKHNDSDSEGLGAWASSAVAGRVPGCMRPLAGPPEIGQRPGGTARYGRTAGSGAQSAGSSFRAAHPASRQRYSGARADCVLCFRGGCDAWPVSWAREGARPEVQQFCIGVNLLIEELGALRQRPGEGRGGGGGGIKRPRGRQCQGENAGAVPDRRGDPALRYLKSKSTPANLGSFSGKNTSGRRS